MTTPVFLETDSTAFDTDRSLTSEHGRRIVRNAFSVFNERCGHIGHSERLVLPNGNARSTRVIITAGWAYHGPIYYYCPVPVGQPNTQRPDPYVRFLLTGRSTGMTNSYVYIINESLDTPTEPKMNSDITGVGDSWYEINTADWQADLQVPVKSGWNRIWIGFKCGTYGTPVSITETIGLNTYPPYLAQVTSTAQPFCSGHPAILAANVTNQSVPAFAIELSVNPASYTNNYVETYTCPIVKENPNKDITILDGTYLLWEPFRDEMEMFGPVFATNISTPYTSTETALSVIAYKKDIDVINLDSFYIDGSQVYQEEEGNIAGLRWWQLPSALQYRQASNFAESARRAVCPMVSVGCEVTRSTIGTPYPLAGSPKTYGWALSETAVGPTLISLFSMSSFPPFAIPDDTVTLEYCFSVCAISWNVSQVEDLTVSVTIYDYDTLSPVIGDASTIQISTLKVMDGSMQGFSVLVRTITWALANNRNPLVLCDYGQEGLTLRGDFQRWQEVKGSISISRNDLTSAPFILAVQPIINTADTNKYYIAASGLSVRIKGS